MSTRTVLCWGIVTCGLLALTGVARAETRLGAYGGLTSFTQVESPSEEDFDTGNRTGYAAGLVLDFGVSDRLWVRLAPGWVEKGATFGFELFGDQIEGEFKLGYVELPLTLDVSLASGSVRPYLIGGGTVAYLNRARASGAADGEEVEEDAKEFFKDWDFGLTFGGGIEFGEDVRGFVEGRYTFGLANVAEEEEGEDFSLKNRGWQVLVGVTFGL
jgi:opacity protein-like surface antigen